MTTRGLVVIALAVLLASAGPAPARTQPAAPDPVAAFLRQIEDIARTGDARAFFVLLADGADRQRAREFAEFELLPGATRIVLQERDRENLRGSLPGNGYRVFADVFAEFGDRARVSTWRFDIRRTGEAFRLVEAERITSTENLYRLSLTRTKQYAAHDLTITAEDLELRLSSGSVFLSEIDQGVTGVVLLGDGDMRFHPHPETERGQVRIFSGSETLDTHFDAAFVRINPAEFESRLDPARLTPRDVNAKDLRRADEIFRQEIPNSFSLDLGVLSPETWSLLPPYGDVLAEIHTKKYDTLTYARSTAEPEDITLFDRKHRHNIALYASQQKLERRGRFYDEDDLTDLDVNDYDIDIEFQPQRLWIQGRVLLRLKVRAPMMNTLTLKLADSLSVQSIVTTRFGRLFPIRVRNQSTIVANLPSPLPRGAEMLVSVSYAGRLDPQPAQTESLQIGRVSGSPQEDLPIVAPEANYLYSNRSYWYPQGQVTDYATARMRFTIPAAYDCVASGDLAVGYPIPADATTDPTRARKVYQFTADQPVRYLAFVVSRFTRTDTVTVVLPPPVRPPIDGDPPPSGVSYDTLSVAVAANPRQAQRGRSLIERATGIAEFYASLVDDCPYPSFTVALVENDLPGGHSPGYFAALNQPLPTTPFVWRNDPAAFQDYPEFFIAHELAHQWWGQAVGWRNYHEQWLSEGFAQYFAALYAEHHRGREVFGEVMRQMRRWAMDQGAQGPVYLGYRLGHIKNDSRVFRALVYNKSAVVLHMLRRLLGDETFFRGVQRFYRESRFRKVGTENLRAAMERESGRSLDRFFERWIYNSTTPRLKFGYRTEQTASGPEVVMRVEQLGEIFDVPVPITLAYADRKPVDMIIPVTDRVAELRVRLAGRLKTVIIRHDDGMLADVAR